jgi:hypothetical protein
MATPKLAFIPGPNDVVVEIGLDPGGKISVKPDPFWVSLGKKEQIVWVCTLNHEHKAQPPCFIVDFDPSDKPFGSAHFQGHPSPSGLASVPANDNKLYKYTVKVGNQTLDPKGGVKP